VNTIYVLNLISILSHITLTNLHRRKAILDSIKMMYISKLKKNLPVYGVVRNPIFQTKNIFLEVKKFRRVYNERKRCLERNFENSPGTCKNSRGGLSKH
jgi:hypothetical protein